MLFFSFLRVAKKGAAKYRVVSVGGPIDLEPDVDFLVSYVLVEIFAIIPCEVVFGNAPIVLATVSACFKLIAVHGEFPQVPSVFI